MGEVKALLKIPKVSLSGSVGDVADSALSLKHLIGSGNGTLGDGSQLSTIFTSAGGIQSLVSGLEVCVDRSHHSLFDRIFFLEVVNPVCVTFYGRCLDKGNRVAAIACFGIQPPVTLLVL